MPSELLTEPLYYKSRLEKDVEKYGEDFIDIPQGGCHLVPSFPTLKLMLGILALRDQRFLRDFAAFCLLRARKAIRESVKRNPTVTIPAHEGLFGNWIAPREEKNTHGSGHYDDAKWFANCLICDLNDGLLEAIGDCEVISKQVAYTYWSIALVGAPKGKEGFRIARIARANEEHAHLRYAYKLYSKGFGKNG